MIFMPTVSANNSPAMRCPPRMLAVPNVSSPGRARASAMRSFTDFTGNDGCTAITIAFETQRVTPAKSLNVSYGNFERANGLIVKLGAISSNVCPSAGARATISAPIAVLAPGRFSTMMFCPSDRVSGCASVRAMMSAAPPGGNGTTMRIGRLGQSCASVVPEHNTATTTATNLRIFLLPAIAYLITNRGSQRQIRSRAKIVA